jgi:SAM-dependent methyltransferase
VRDSILSIVLNEPTFDPGLWEEVASYVQGLDDGGKPLATRIHSADEMYLYDLSMAYQSRETAAIFYFSAGQLIFRTVAEIVRWRFGSFDAVRSFLDFASGYGRSTRFLVRALAPERLSVAEVDPEAVRFQEETFGVRGIVSGPEPEALQLDRPYDVILACSFFSHLPAARFEAWLQRLQTALTPGGILIFSTHGMELLEPEADRSTSGIVFRPVSETNRLDSADYGTSYVTSEFVRSTTDRATGGEGRLLTFPFGLGGFQDLYVLLRPPLPPVLDLRLARFPRGSPDDSAIGDGVVSVEGWAVGDTDERPPDVRLFLRDTVAGFSPGEGMCGSRRRWSFSFPVSAVSPDDVVRVEAESERGLSKILVIGTLRPYLENPPESQSP